MKVTLTACGPNQFTATCDIEVPEHLTLPETTAEIAAAAQGFAEFMGIMWETESVCVGEVVNGTMRWPVTYATPVQKT